MNECAHDWEIYDVYWVTPNFGNAKCKLCGARKKSIRLTDAEVIEFADRMEGRYLDDED